MKAAEIPANESDRLEALRRYEILDTPAEDQFDDFTRLASRILKTPIALISLVDAGRQWIKSRTGIEFVESPRDVSFCGHTILGRDVFEVPNALMDERFHDNPFVTGNPNIRFYAGAPLTTPEGHAIGSLCVIDRVPRKLSSEEAETLQTLGRLVVQQLELRLKLAELQQNIVERKRMEAELAQARDAAMQSVRLKAEFLANMSHEIRTPMNGVIGMTGLLLETPLSGDQEHYVSTIRNCGDSLLTIINDILDFSKIEARKLVFEVVDFDLRELVESALEMMAERAHAKKLELAALIKPETPTRLRGDPGRLRQVLLNLIGNAIKFTERGEVAVRIAKTSESASHTVLRFEVRDTGIGIPAEAANTLFQAFTQADGSTTRKYGGSGLGLAISKQLAEMMQGQIGVDSVPGRGSTFWFTAQLEKHPPGVVPLEKPVADLAKVRALIVDDNATNREILEHQASSWKMRHTSAASGDVALQLLRGAAGDPFDLAILDMQMPEMDGCMLAHRIKADPQIARTRLIMLTSMGGKLDQDELCAAGIAACLSKPVKQSVLFDCLTAVMGHAPVEDRRIVPAAGEPQVIHSLRLLLAEDNVINQEVAVKQLSKLGYQADVVANGREALEALARSEYDAVLMDCQMPEMDGYQATREIRQREQREQRRRVRIIAMTAHAMQGDRDECLAAGMDDHISKPVHLADLKRALQRIESPPGGAADPAAPASRRPADSSPAFEPPVDLERLQELTDGNAEMRQQLLERYFAQADDLLQKLRAAMTTGNAKDISQLAHKLAGSSATCGMTAMVPALKELELLGQAGDLSNAAQCLELAGKASVDLRQFLAKHFASQGGAVYSPSK